MARTNEERPPASPGLARPAIAGADKQDGHFINGLAKGLSIIQAFNNEARALTLAEAAARTGLTRAAARRILMTLEDLGFAVRCDERHFVLTPRVLSLGYAYLSSMPLWTFAEPVLEELVEQVGETCSIGALDDTELVYVVRIPVHRTLSHGLSIGSRIPLYCHSAGRVLLSGLTASQLDSYFARVRMQAFTPHTVTDPDTLRQVIDGVRRRGHAWSSGEMEEHTSGLSVPIYQDGRVIAALNMSRIQVMPCESEWLSTYLPRLKRAAEKLTSSLTVGGPSRVVRMGRRAGKQSSI